MKAEDLDAVVGIDDEFMDHLGSLGVQKINTLVDRKDSNLTHFFSANQFSPSETINLEQSL